MTKTMQRPQLTDSETLRKNARKHLERGALTEGYGADRERVVELLNTALATELTCMLRYRRHYFTASGLHAESIAQEFLEHSNEEQAHADRLAERIVQLGGSPDFAPSRLEERSHAEYTDETDLRSMVEANLVAERIAVESYAELIRYVGDDDPTTRRLLEDILALEEEHADELAGLLEKDNAQQA